MTAFLLVPRKVLIMRFCLIHLKKTSISQRCRDRLMMIRSCCCMSKLSATMVFAPLGAVGLALVVNK